MPPRPHRRLALALLALAAAPFTTPAHAAEHITLQNGFDLICIRREPQPSGLVRLFLTGSPDSLNYLDVAPGTLASIETVPDPPPPVTSTATPAPAHPQDLHALLLRSGAQHNVDAELLASIVHAESNGSSPHAISRTGARGLMQLMPATATQMGVADAFLPDQNVEGGTRYFDAMLTRYHDNIALALAAYNAGPGAVDRYHGVPPFHETRAYVARVIREFNHRKLALLAQAH